MPMPQTLFEKVKDGHLVGCRADGREIIYMDRHVAHELHSPRAFQRLRETKRSVRRPDLSFQALDHTVSTFRALGGERAEESPFIKAARAGCQEFGVHVFDVDDAEHGISHVVAPEIGLITPGSSYACPDSHACTVGALGVLAFGIGTSELEHVFATQTLAINPLKTMRVWLDGTLPKGVGGKDVILKIIAECGVSSGAGHAVEYAGPVIEAMSMEGRMTICNMAIEMGARTGIIAPDETTIEWLAGRPHMLTGRDWDDAVAWWKTLRSDDGAEFDTDVTIDCDGLEPQVSWGIDPSQVVGVGERVPAPGDADADHREAFERALDYMDLVPGTPLQGIKIDRVFIGSCTNSRLPDLEEAAAILRGRHIADGVKAVVTPGSLAVKREVGKGIGHHISRRWIFLGRNRLLHVCRWNR